MFTPQQIDQISFGRSTFGGYDMQQVDEFLEPLTEDYVTLYKENALLKSKMRVLVGKLEEYRKNEASMKEAVVNAQKTCDKMVAEAEAKCAKMLGDASSLATTNTQTSETQMAAENARVEEARRVAAAKINELQDQLRSCIQALDRIKEANRPIYKTAAFDYDRSEGNHSTDAVADEELVHHVVQGADQHSNDAWHRKLSQQSADFFRTQRILFYLVHIGTPFQ